MNDNHVLELEARFRAICDQAIVGIAQVDFGGRILFANDRFLEIVGYPRAELMQMRMRELTHPNDVPTSSAQFRSLLAGGPDLSVEKRYIRQDGSIVWVRNHVNGIRDMLGKVTSIVAMSVDITQERQQQEALRASEARYRAFVDHALDGLFLHDATGRLLDVNRHACVMLGYARDELIGQTPAFFDPDASPVLVSHRMGRLAKGETIAFDALHRRKDGARFPVAVRVRPFFVDGEFYALSLAHDITDRVKTEAALRDYADQLRELSRRLVDVQEDERRHLARELHDEIGQVLSIVSINLQTAKGASATSAWPLLEESIAAVNGAIEQVRSLSLDLRPPMLDELGLIDTLRWCADRQAASAGFDLHFVHKASGAALPPATQIVCYRVAQEALTNAARHSHAKNVWLQLTEFEDFEVRLAISDDGVGIDLPAVGQRPPRTSGFGLRGMRERVELVGGRLHIETRPGGGTTVRARMPLSTARH